MNRGKEVQTIVVVDFPTAFNVIQKVQTNGLMFSVEFLKKDGTFRQMNCRCGVKKHLNGNGAKYKFSDRNLISVYECGVGYRLINLGRIISVKQGETAYLFYRVNTVPKSTISVAV